MVNELGQKDEKKDADKKDADKKDEPCGVRVCLSVSPLSHSRFMHHGHARVYRRAR